jgi:hypothetical protein
MKRYKLPVLTLVVIAIGVLVSWPLIHTALIRHRIKRAVVESRSPGPVVSAVHFAISEFDPPAKVLNVLWEMAVSPESTTLEMQYASLTLGMLGASEDTLIRGDRYTHQDWNDAFTALLVRERANRPKMSDNMKVWFDELEKNWQASAQLRAGPP